MTALKQVSASLRNKIFDLMDDLNFLDLSVFDYRAIGHNLLNNYSEEEITDDLIISEIVEFYSA